MARALCAQYGEACRLEKKLLLTTEEIGDVLMSRTAFVLDPCVVSGGASNPTRIHVCVTCLARRDGLPEWPDRQLDVLRAPEVQELLDPVLDELDGGGHNLQMVSAKRRVCRGGGAWQ